MSDWSNKMVGYNVSFLVQKSTDQFVIAQIKLKLFYQDDLILKDNLLADTNNQTRHFDAC